MSNPFLEDGESTHEYNNQMFVVDFYPHPLGNTWQCSDSSHYIRARANTKQEAIDQAHKEWDEHKKIKAMTNNNQQTAVEWLIEQLHRKYGGTDFFWTNMDEIEQAKQMEKEIIIDAIITCEKEHYVHSKVYPPQFVIDKAEQYYNNKYENEKQ